MLKKSAHIIFLIGLHVIGISQTNLFPVSAGTKNSDSLKQKLREAGDDSSRIKIMSTIGFFYEPLNVDSSLKYTQTALTLARKRGYIWAEPELMINLASTLRQQGNLAESIDLLFKSLKIAEANNLTREIGRAYRRLGDVYFDLENFPKGIEYILLALKIDEKNEAETGIAIDHMTLGYAYEKINKLDSASYHVDQAFQRKDILKNWLQYMYQALGNIQLKKENYAGGISLLREGLTLSQKNNDFKTASDICSDLSAQLIKLDKKDSAIFYASKSYEFSQHASSKKGIIRSGILLAELYDSIQPETSLNYFKIATAAKDSLFGLNNIQTIQGLVSREEARQKELEDAQISYHNRLKLYGALTGLTAFLVIAFILYRNNRQKQKANVLLLQQKEKIEFTLTELKAAQAQLIQSEKMASLGELTAGIAHEIQNPLNFVNNFSELSRELIDELKSQKESLKTGERDDILNDIDANLEKINHHGKRADAIVKSMLEHSRTGSGEKQLTDINALTDEYLRINYQSFKNKNPSFKAAMQTNFDTRINQLHIIPQHLGSVLLNLFNNAFYTVNEKNKNQLPGYEPLIIVSTRKMNDKVWVSVKDNGLGIPAAVVTKIFQPFFTTKPAGQGTGLGLSLSYDIVTNGLGGSLKVETKEGEGSEFIIQLPA